MTSFKHYRDEIFQTVDAISWTLSDKLPRYQVHQEGQWHFGVQAIILQKDENGKIFTLTQTRSLTVDISAEKIDQSLATQQITSDKSNLIETLKRGLKNEFGINLERCRYVEALPTIKKVLTKTYSSSPKAYNREIVYLFLVELDQCERIVPDIRKIKRTNWEGWDTFISNAKLNSKGFTKTLRLYFQDRKIVKQLNSEVNKFLNGNFVSSEFSLNQSSMRLNEKYYYHYISLSHLNFDYSIYCSLAESGEMNCKINLIPLKSGKTIKKGNKIPISRLDFFELTNAITDQLV